MGRPSISRSVKRRRLRALDQAADVPGQLTPTHVEAITGVMAEKPAHVPKPRATKKKAKKAKKASRNFGRKSK